MELMQISTVPCRTAGTNTLPCGSAAVEALQLPSFNTTGRFFPIFLRDSLRQHLRWYWHCCFVRWSSNVAFFIGSIRLWKSLECISFCVQVLHSQSLLQEFQQLQAGFTMFRTVTFLYVARAPRYRKMPLIFMHASCIFMSSHVCTSESHLVLEVFQVLARRVVEARCAQNAVPEVMISPKIWFGQVAPLIQDQFLDDAPARNSKQWTFLKNIPINPHTWM